MLTPVSTRPLIQQQNVNDLKQRHQFESVFLLVVWMAMYLTSHSDYLTGFHEPFSAPYRCHTSLKNV